MRCDVAISQESIMITTMLDKRHILVWSVCYSASFTVSLYQEIATLGLRLNYGVGNQMILIRCAKYHSSQ